MWQRQNTPTARNYRPDREIEVGNGQLRTEDPHKFLATGSTYIAAKAPNIMSAYIYIFINIYTHIYIN